MRPKLRKLGVALGALVLLLVLVVGTLMLVSWRRENARYEIQPTRLEVPSDEASLAEGERLYTIRGCAECHGARGEGGRVVMDAPPGLFVGTNLTRSSARLDDVALERAIRHGVGEGGRPLLFMPSEELWPMSDRDVARIIAYVRSLPPVGEEAQRSSLRPLGRVLHVLGAFPAISAEVIAHDAERPSEVEVGPTVEYGRYLATGCTGCHGAGLSGGPIPGAPPELGLPRNLTPHETGLARWSEADFVRSMREGRTPDGQQLDGTQMPYAIYARMTDVELSALYAYLRSLPAKPAGNR